MHRPPWPYGPLPPEFVDAVPSWGCVSRLCTCRGRDPQEDWVDHHLFLHDDVGMRMPGARYRLYLQGHRVGDGYADPTGVLEQRLPEGTTSVVLEWAPPDVPVAPPFPYRRRVWTTLSAAPPVRPIRDRLAHLGFSNQPDTSGNVADFQRAYGMAVDGKPRSVEAHLIEMHDRGRLPPALPDVARSHEPIVSVSAPALLLQPDIRGPRQGAVAAMGSVPNLDGALTVSDKSHVNAARFVQLLKADETLPSWFRDAVHAAGAHQIKARVDVSASGTAGDPDLNRRRREENARLRRAGVSTTFLESIDAVVRVIQSDRWHLATGAFVFERDRLGAGIAYTRRRFIGTGLEPGDPLIDLDSSNRLRRVELPVRLDESGGGVTVPVMMTQDELDEVEDDRMRLFPRTSQDYFVARENGQGSKGFSARRSPTRGLVWSRSILVISTPSAHVRVHEEDHPKTIIVDALHEIGAHADFLNQFSVDFRHGGGSGADNRSSALERRMGSNPHRIRTEERLRTKFDRQLKPRPQVTP